MQREYAIVFMQIITTQSCHHLHNRLITMLGAGQQCVIECQKHNEVKFLNKNTTKLGFQHMSHIHILFTMIIILNITKNRLTAAATPKHIIC